MDHEWQATLFTNDHGSSSLLSIQRDYGFQLVGKDNGMKVNKVACTMYFSLTTALGLLGSICQSFSFRV